jgi:hypothetical protein
MTDVTAMRNRPSTRPCSDAPPAQGRQVATFSSSMRQRCERMTCARGERDRELQGTCAPDRWLIADSCAGIL